MLDSCRTLAGVEIQTARKEYDNRRKERIGAVERENEQLPDEEETRNGTSLRSSSTQVVPATMAPEVMCG